MTAALGEVAAGGAAEGAAAGVGATRAAGAAGATASKSAGKSTGTRSTRSTGSHPSSGLSGSGKKTGGNEAQLASLPLGIGKTPLGQAAKVPARTAARRLLIAEFIVCVIILALIPMTGKEPTPKDWMKKGTAICGLFVVLGMIGAVGPKTERAMAAFGGLVTLALLVNERSIFVKIAEKFNAGAGGSAVGEALAEGDATEVGPLDGMGGSIVGGAVGGLGLR